MPAPTTTLITGGTVYDGSGGDGERLDVEVADGRIRRLSAAPLPLAGHDRVIDATGCWITPGFLEVHSHYDAEVVAAPSLAESVRHGVTTVVVGNCSLSTVMSEPRVCADLFSRVEALPHQLLIEVLGDAKVWSTPAEYRSWLEHQPLGPNVAAMLGHSDVRAAVMGLDRSTLAGLVPTALEQDLMVRSLQEAVDAGFLGLSTMTTKLDRVAGDVAWSRPLPSTFAPTREVRALHRVLRQHRRVLQSAPDAQAPTNLLFFLRESIGLRRRPLRTSLLTASDLRSNRLAHRLTRAAAALTNALGGDLRFQTLPSPFAVRADGLEFANFEEFGSGAALRDLKDPARRAELLTDPAFRRRFRRDLSRLLVVGLWDRRLDRAWIVACPDPDLVGRTLEEVGADRGQHPADAFLDLVAAYGDDLCWEAILGNDRPQVLRRLLASPNTQVGFADSGAHLRNLAFYNFPLRALSYVRWSHGSEGPKLKVGQVVRKLTAELADFWNLDAGRLREGDRGDVVVIRPEGLDASVFLPTYAPYPELEMERLVNRNDRAVEAVLINGELAYDRTDGLAEDLGQARRYGRFLAAGAGSARVDAVAR